MKKPDLPPYETPPEFQERIAYRTGLSRDDIFAPSFQNLPYREQAEAILSDLSVYFHPLTTDPIRDRCTTIYLRSNCGCEERYYDEVLEEWVDIDGHSGGCLKTRFPIVEDLSDKTIKRHKQRERPHAEEGLMQVQEMIHG